MSRRLGVSLGINLLPTNRKICSFNCIYCECGWTEKANIPNEEFPPADLILEILENKIIELVKDNAIPDSITFAGNGEPTLHPEFPQIVEKIIILRNKYLPKTLITLLSNATTISDVNIAKTLLNIDQTILKLDAGDESLFQFINRPLNHLSKNNLVENIASFKEKVIIQSLFLRGIQADGIVFDNTTTESVNEWILDLKKIKPLYVMIYPIARSTPLKGIEKISKANLDNIAKQLISEGIMVKVYE
jgi:wyosine [tRNA(Phe)-imidazoG37] synthetase (radical SAM superfamily)